MPFPLQAQKATDISRLLGGEKAVGALVISAGVVHAARNPYMPMQITRTPGIPGVDALVNR